MKQWAPELALDLDASGIQAITVLLSFLLMNIKCDFFAPSGQATLIFEFGGHFGRDVTYSLSWSLFALAMMGYGLRYRIRESDGQAGSPFHDPVEGLFHDMAQLDQLYRIAALVGGQHRHPLFSILSAIWGKRTGFGF